MTTQIAKARAAVNAHRFGTPEWEAAMVQVRALVAAASAARPAEPFCSLDSGEHPTVIITGNKAKVVR